MAWLPDDEKSLKICLFILTEYTNVTDRQTDGRTRHDGTGRAYTEHRAAKMVVILVVHLLVETLFRCNVCVI